MKAPAGPSGVVLAGAAALGAYEVGVLQHVVDAVARELGRPRIFDVVSGTSAGAINAAALAAFADRPALGAARLGEAWTGLRLGQMLRPSAIELLLSLVAASESTARLARALQIRRARGGVLDPGPITRLLASALPFERIEGHLASGALRAAAIALGRADARRRHGELCAFFA